MKSFTFLFAYVELRKYVLYDPYLSLTRSVTRGTFHVCSRRYLQHLFTYTRYTFDFQFDELKYLRLPSEKEATFFSITIQLLAFACKF